jgi:2-polyprenyl-6-hydroxyphenyl methylase/3-demethylubiquinone-9 3-methyltransferase
LRNPSPNRDFVGLTQAIANPDPAVAKRAFEAMMQMQKIDIAAIEAACRG